MSSNDPRFRGTHYTREQSSSSSIRRVSIVQRIGLWVRKSKAQIPFAIFIGLSCYVGWLMESENERLKRKVLSTKTALELEKDKEQKLLKQLQSDPSNQDFNRQIREFQRSTQYRYEVDDESILN